MKIACFVLLLACGIGLSAPDMTAKLGAQESKSPGGAGAKPGDQPSSSGQDGVSSRLYSGAYTFLKEGEFVQLTVEDDGRITGFISRFGDGENDKGAFLDQFFKSGKLEGAKLNFTTQTIHGVAFDFQGSVERGEGKNPGDEAYFVLKGTLTQNTTDADKRVNAHSQQVAFKLFPQDTAPAAEVRK